MRVKLLQTNRMLRLLLCLAVAIMAANGTFAQSVNRATARRVAETFFNQNVKNGESQPVQFEDVTAETEFQNFYIFSADSGFVIVAGDERVIPILGYSKTSPFVTENMPENLRWWLEGYDGQIREVMDNSIPATAEIATKWSCLKTGEAEPVKGNRSVELPLTTKWDQGTPYNSFCPIIGGDTCVTGCTATALAQVLKYWNYPIRGVGNKTLDITQINETVKHPECYPIYVDFSATTYDWHNMDDVLTSSSPQEKIDAVATLMKHCGVAMNMNYGVSSEGGSLAPYIMNSLVEYFDYSEAGHYEFSINYQQDEEWKNLLKREIDAHRPIAYRGESDGAHAFVFYGYDNGNRFLVNWGWGGFQDDYFAIGALNPEHGGIGGGNYDYNKVNGALLHVMPNDRTLNPPASFTVNNTNGNDLQLEWSSAQYAGSYVILRNGKFLAETTLTNYLDVGVYGGSYTYQVITVGENHRASLPSDGVTYTIPYETPVPTNLSASFSGSTVELSWESPQNSIPIRHYATPFTADFEAVSCASGTSYCYEVFRPSDIRPYADRFITNVVYWTSTNEIGREHTVEVWKGKFPESDLLTQYKFTPSTSAFQIMNLPDPIRIDNDDDICVRIMVRNPYGLPIFDCIQGDNTLLTSYIDTEGSIEKMPSGKHFVIDLYMKWANELTYNVYRNGVCIARNLQEPNYTDTNVPAGLCSYYVTTNYFGGESEPSETVSVSCGNCTITTTCSPSNGGSISGNQGSYPAGSTVTLVATPVSGYTFSNWTENDSVVSTSASYSFTVTGNRTLVANFVVSGGSSHEYVDLGLPSGTLWATCNVGANVPEEYGDYFCWGETQTKDSYIGTQYGSYGNFTKYCNNSNYGHNGYIDNLTILQPEDDAATANWGNGWRMPTYEEWNELLNNTTNTWVTRNGVNGRLFTSSNGASLFLPAAGGYWASNHQYTGDGGYYWSSSLGMVTPDGACYLNICEAYYADQLNNGYYRRYGFSVRAVHASQSSATTYIVTATPNPRGGGTLTSEQQGQTCTLRATANTDYTFTNWTENGTVVSANASYSFTVTGNRTLVANFTLNPLYTISASANPSNGGTISGGGSYRGGTTCTVTATPNAGYTFSNWTENGTVVSTNANYSFTVTGDRNLVANYTPNPLYTISASANPSNGGTISGGGSYRSGTTCTLTATANTGYDFKNWTVNGTVVSTNATYSFTVTGNRTLVANFVFVGAGSYVDLGLPSGTLWANCNVGANAPEEYGNYFAWGETQQKNAYDWSTYQYCYGHLNTLIKYCNNSQYGYNGYTDNLTMLLSGDDAATTNWGNDWRIPTKEEWEELMNTTTHIWTTRNGVNGRLFTATNGNTLFLPATGWRDGSSLIEAGNDSDYWSSTLSTDSPYQAWKFGSHSANYRVNYAYRDYGRSVRAVRATQSSAITYIVKARPNNVEGGTLTNTQQGQRCTVTATSNIGYTFNNWTENGTVVSTNASYTFTVTGNRTLVANFVDNTENYTITASASLSNGGTVSGGGTYQGSSTCTLIASANDGYSFTNWTENGIVVSTEASYSFMVTGNRTLVANFVEGNLIGDGDDATNVYLPSYSYYKYSLTQQIYTADEIGMAGSITSIAFYNGGTEKTRTYDMYLVHTNKTNFDSDTDWITVTEADKVFSNSMVMVANDWTVFVLDTPFAYDGTSNLAIIIDDNSGDYTNSPHMACRVFNANGNQAIRVYSDNTNYDPMSPPTSYESGEYAALQSVKNQIVFEILPPYHFITSGYWGNASNWSGGVLPGANNAVFIDANCILNMDAEVASLTITSGKMLTLRSDKTLTVTGTLSNTATTSLVIQNGAQLINSSANVAATLRKSISTHGNTSNGWYTIASPMNGTVITNSGFATYDYDLYRFNETNLTNEEWENYKANLADFTTFEKGRGYLYANSKSFSPNFTGILNASAVTYSLTCTNRPNDPLSGFNLIGNPFPHKIYKGAGGAIDDVNLASGYYTLTNEGTWQVHSFDDAIQPGQGFLVKATAPTVLTIAKSNEEAFAESGDAKRGTGRLCISVAGDSGQDRAYVYFGQGNDLNKVEDMTKDAPSLAIRNGNGDFAIAHCDKNSDVVELVFTTPTDGSFTLIVDVAGADFKYLHLIDQLTGDDIDLLALRCFDIAQQPQAHGSASYIFEAKTTDNANRFKLVFDIK